MSKEFPAETVCPHCGEDGAYAYSSRPVFKCTSCGKQFSSTSGGPWRSSKLPLEKRALIERLFAEGLNALEVSKRAGVQYRTAWQAAKRLAAEHADV